MRVQLLLVATLGLGGLAFDKDRESWPRLTCSLIVSITMGGRLS